MERTPGEIRLTAEHKAILEQFRKFAGRRLSAEELNDLTNIEPIKISAILADLMAHGMLRYEEPEESGGAWVYSLTDQGRTFASELG